MQSIGKIHSLVLVSIVLNEEPTEQYGRRRYGLSDAKDARLAARVALVNALAALDIYYHGRRRNPTRASHADDYRPGIPPIDNSSPPT